MQIHKQVGENVIGENELDQTPNLTIFHVLYKFLVLVLII